MNIQNKIPPNEGIKICLNMIVKNESAIIERSLASTIGHIDYYVIGDTGSNDDTINIIKNFFDKHNVPGEIHQFPFIDFAQARNKALEHARESKGVFDYIFFNDADMELKPETDDWKKNIVYPLCSIRQKNDIISYYNARLVHRSIEAHYIGKTHEYLSAPMATRPIEGVWLIDHANGSSRSVKTERDLRLLKESLKENPNDARSLFYIAQTLKDLGRWYDALGYYKRRIKVGGWEEEIWYSHYMSALCYQQLGKEDQFVTKSLEAFEMRPWRAETLLPLAKHYREAGKNELALMISERGASIKFPENDSLFVESYVYQHAFENEIAICGFYAKEQQKKDRGYLECMKLSASATAPLDIQKLALKNSAFYAKEGASIFPSFKSHEIVAPCSPGYISMNPSVAVHEDKTYCVIRTVNYTMDEHGRYNMPSDQIIRTENFFCKLYIANDKIILQTATKIEPNNLGEKNDFPVKGFEDCRLFWWKQQWWCSATVRDRHPNGQCEIAIFTIDGDKEHVFHSTEEHSFIENRHQKNWMPHVTSDDRLLFIYSCDPTVVLEVNEAFQVKELHHDECSKFELSELRGGSQCIAWKKDRYLCLTHEAFYGGKRKYLHRFIELDKEFKITRVSDLFYLTHPGIEFCAGMACTSEGQILISFGVEDRNAHVASIECSDIDNHMNQASQQ